MMDAGTTTPPGLRGKPAYDFSGVQILVVDPSAFFRHLVRDMLRAFGVWNVAEASNPDAALDLLATDPYDFLLTELEFPGGALDGFDFVREVRQGGEVRDPKIATIAITGRAERHHVLEARDAGITEFLAKPVSAARLFHRLTMVVDRPRGFVWSENYVGPDRRRFQNFDYHGPERRNRSIADGDSSHLTDEGAA